MAGVAVTGVFVGLATLDVVHRVQRLPGRDEKVTAIRQDVAAGGPATGAAITFAALGGRATLVTVLGRCAVAGLVAEELGGRGVVVVDVDPGSAVPVPVSAVAVVEATGERSVTSPDAAGHAVQLSPAALEALGAAVAGADVLLVDGHHPDLARTAAAAARAAGVPVVLDAGRWRPVMADLLPLLDVAVCSAVFRTPGADDAEATARAVRAAGVAVVVTTAGPEPVRWWDGAASGAVDVPPVPAGVARDTLGAGDAFHGAYAWALATGRGTAAAVGLAARVASHRVSVVGPRAWLEDLPGVAGRGVTTRGAPRPR